MGSSGGGGSSGAVSHAAYLETIHKDWLNASGADTIEKSITEVMDSALGSSPWIGKSAYDPDADIASYAAAIASYAVILAGISETADWDALYTQAETTLSDAAVIADTALFGTQMDDELVTKVLPRFRRGMQDINAVSSSAFVLGEAVIEAFKDRDVAKYGTALRLHYQDQRLTATEQMLRLMMQRVSWEEGHAKLLVESMRIKIVAKKEQTDQNDTIDEADAKWDLEVFQHGSNVLASIGGGTAITNMPGKNRASSVIGGALMGAAAGAMIGGPTPAAPFTAGMGAIYGGLLGAGMGFL